jgi:hypothetical protein
MTRTKKTRVKSTARADKMAARWKDPVYAAKMREAAKRGAAAANAKRKNGSPSSQPTDPAGAPVSKPVSTTPAGPEGTQKKTATVRSWSPGRRWA